jgi:hypothetical protein
LYDFWFGIFKGKAFDIVNDGICLLSTCNKFLDSKADYKFVIIFLAIYLLFNLKGGEGGFESVFCKNPLQCWEKDDSARGWRGRGRGGSKVFVVIRRNKSASLAH